MNDAIERWAGSYTAEELKRQGEQGMNGMELGDVEELSMKYNNEVAKTTTGEFADVGGIFMVRLSDVLSIIRDGKTITVECSDSINEITFKTKTKATTAYGDLAGKLFSF